MSFSKYSFLLLLFNAFALCSSSFVDTLNKCGLKDSECHKKLIQSILKTLAKTGAEEIGIPSIDPIEVSDITIKALDLIEFTLVKGTAIGIQGCVSNRFELNIEEYHAFVELTCDLTITGKYKVFTSSPAIKNLLKGDTVHGDGNGSVKLDKINIKLDASFFFVKKDGEIYFKFDPDTIKDEYNFNNIVFDADNLYIGDVESSKQVVKLLNDNQKFVITTFGKPVTEEVTKIVMGFLDKFFDGVPTKYYSSDDLSPYVKT